MKTPEERLAGFSAAAGRAAAERRARYQETACARRDPSGRMNSMDEATLREVQALPGGKTAIAEAEAYWRRVQEERRLERVRECEANRSHVWQMDETACPHCDTPYVECP